MTGALCTHKWPIESFIRRVIDVRFHIRFSFIFFTYTVRLSKSSLGSEICSYRAIKTQRSIDSVDNRLSVVAVRHNDRRESVLSRCNMELMIPIYLAVYHITSHGKNSYKCMYIQGLSVALLNKHANVWTISPTNNRTIQQLCRGYMWNKIISKLFHGLIAAHEYFPTYSMLLK